MTGIDRHFDYAVPESMSMLAVGDRVRVDLNGRRVGGWVVGLSAEPSSGVDADKLRTIVSRSGTGVVSEMVDLCRWVAQRWCGPFRSALSVASAPRVRIEKANPRHGRIPEQVADPVLSAVEAILASGGGCLRVPPAASALSAISAVARRGPVLAICPTHRMATLGAAALRRKGLGVALVPDDWATAVAGADVVIGARSAVFAPCPGLATIVVIDEHDEALKEERSPAWDATSVARERGSRAGVPVVTTSPVPSVFEHRRTGAPGTRVEAAVGWPRVVVADLGEVNPAGSLLHPHLLAAARDTSLVTLAILNTKGKAVLLSCKSCGELQRCPDCRSLLTESGDGLWCVRCECRRGAVCQSCGRTAFKVLRQGTAGLRAEIERSVGVSTVEVTTETPLEDLRGGLFVGTEALLRRVDNADVVVFCDLDRDLGAPRITAPREVLADIARAGRVVGTRGTVVVQTRDLHHPLVRCLASDDIDRAIESLLAEDMVTREALGMPPYSTMVRFTAERDLTLDDAVALPHVQWFARHGVLFAKIAERDEVDRVTTAVTDHSGLRLRVHVDPSRY